MHICDPSTGEREAGGLPLIQLRLARATYQDHVSAFRPRSVLVMDDVCRIYKTLDLNPNTEQENLT